MRGTIALILIETARENGLMSGLASVKLELAACRVESANSCWSAHSVVEGLNKVGEDVSNALMAMYEKATHAAEGKVSITGLDLKDALRRVSSLIKIESQAAISRFRSEFERDDNEVLRNIGLCRAVFPSRVV